MSDKDGKYVLEGAFKKVERNAYDIFYGINDVITEAKARPSIEDNIRTCELILSNVNDVYSRQSTLNRLISLLNNKIRRDHCE